ncbi:NAD(P)/FAD-dependent oxidoreductase [Kribbella sp. NBC_00359]|uniref:NAD(P)/FAD-dependent oxidoreductase n=1 Tax=Kribbella sp. NBC_00359 TaxID=2975966 RepID=UPI002E20D576
MKTYDVAVIGGSVAGLQAALTLGRARRRVLLFDDGNPRNRTADHVHNYLGAENPSPADLLASGHHQLEQHDVEFRDTRVDEVSVDGDGLAVGSDRVRAVVLATGLRDELPDVPGVTDSWGRLVVACPHCHGWEVRDQPLVQLGMRGLPDRSVARALLLSRWSNDVVLCTDGDELTDDQLTKLGKAGVQVRTERVEAVHPGDDQVRVLLTTGEALVPRALFVVVRQHQQSDLAARLGCEIVDGAVSVDGGGRTTVPGVYAVGTTAVPALFAIGAAGHASTTAVALHADLLEQEL